MPIFAPYLCLIDAKKKKVMRRRNSDMEKFFITKWAKVALAFCLYCLLPLKGACQTGEGVADALAEMGFENVRWVENAKERVYTIENNMYRVQSVGIAKAVEVIQEGGLPKGKRCRVIVLSHNIPQVALTYDPLPGADSLAADTTGVSGADWSVSYELEDSWKNVKKERKRNSSLFKVDLLVYPQLYFKNVVITQIYQACLEISPAIEVSLWPGSRLTAQVIFPAYNDGYPGEMKKIRPGYLTLEQNFRLPYRIKGQAVVGVFDRRTFGGELNLFYPFRDERFSLEGKFGVVGEGYFRNFSTFRYNGATDFYCSVGGNFYWPQYDTQIKLCAERYLLKEVGMRAELIRHFKYVSIGFYAVKCNKADSNGGFKLTIALPPYKYKRHKYIPRVSTGAGTGITYNAGNEAKYYLMPYSTVDGHLMTKQNEYNPFFIKRELTN